MVSTAETCRYCLRPIIPGGMFWANDRGEIYCPVSRGQHEPARKEPDET